MEKPSKKSHEFTGNLIKEGGLYSPPEGFTDHVMKEIVRLKEVKISFKPLISRNGWFFLCFILALVIVLLFVYPENSQNGFLGQFQQKVSSLSIPELEIPKEMIYGIGFLGMFLIQVPFLRRLIERKIL